MLLLVLFFVLAATTDWITVLWHRAREERQIARLAGLSMVLESLTWLPLWVAWSQNNWGVAVACVLGSGLGTVLGMRKITVL